jgi:DNA-binding LytR/AlgR family response regulator
MSRKHIACILDDEKPARDELRFIVEESFGQIELAAEFGTADRAYTYLKDNPCDLLFLDIEMPEESGIAFAERINQELDDLPYIIFVTAYDEFAIKAFDLDAVDYLLKPVNPSRLEQAIGKMEERMRNKPSLFQDETEQLKALLAKIGQQRSQATHITFAKGDKLVPIQISEVIFATVSNKVIRVQTLKGEFEFGGSLSELEEQLSSSEFFRSHKSYLINLALIENINIWFNGSFQVNLKGSEELIPVSRKQAKEFKKRLNIK